MSVPPPDLSPPGTAALLSFAEGVAREAGAMIRKAFAAPTGGGDYDRKSALDPVTETDRAVERMVFGRIRQRFPGHALIGEESAAGVEWTGAATWIVDPIDGTANFVHRIPLCAVSIAFTYERSVKVGVIYNPLLDEMFSATHLTPSTLNGVTIHVSQIRALHSACVATECGSDRTASKVDEVLRDLRDTLVSGAMCVRMMGSCALNLAHVACGRVDVYHETGP